MAAAGEILVARCDASTREETAAIAAVAVARGTVTSRNARDACASSNPGGSERIRANVTHSRRLPRVDVVHAGGALQDAVVGRQTVGSLAAVAAPKVSVAARLADAFASFPVTGTLLFSSVAALLGSPGQAKSVAAPAAWDARAVADRFAGRPVASVRWGAWGGDTGGMAVNDAGTLSRLARVGVGALTPEQGVYALGRIVAAASGPATIVVNPFDWDAFAKSVPRKRAATYEDFVDVDALGRLEGDDAAETHAEDESIAMDVGAIRRVILDAATPLLDGGFGEVGDDDPLMERGLDSLGAVELRKTLAARLSIDLPPTVLFDHPSIGALARFVAERVASTSRPRRRERRERSDPKTTFGPTTSRAFSHSVADGGVRSGSVPVRVVSSSCEYPRGISSAAALRDAFARGVEFQETIPPDRFDAESCGSGARFATFVADVDAFDADAFRVSDAEASAMDPQQRKLLDLCLRNYAASPEGALRAAAGASTGVYLGVMWTEYQHLAAAVDAPRTGYLATGNGLSFLVGRPSFVFGLVGPSAVVDTACSSSLVAARMATRAVAVGEASDAHAAGTQCMLLADTFDVLDSLRALSPDGRCKTLDAAADGYGRGDGFAAAYLRPERAEDVRDDAASDSVRVLGSSVNQDGRSSTFTAPFGPSQHALVRDALLEARADPATVRFLSAHGTGTSLGDPIEFAAAGRALDACDVVLLGASKSFLGHTEGAAGLSALFLAVAAAANAHAPSLRHCRNLNPHVAAGLASSATSGGVAFAATRSALAPFAPVPGVQGVIAGASSFGMSGVNAHCIVRVTSPPHDRGGRVLVADAGRFWCASGARVTALLDSARIVSAATATFRCHLGAPRLAYADHHRIDGVAIFPGTASMEAARVALGEDADGRGTLVDVAFVKPLVLARDGDPLDLVVVVAKADGKVRVGEERTRREGNGNPYPPPRERRARPGAWSCRRPRRVAAHADESGSKRRSASEKSEKTRGRRRPPGRSPSGSVSIPAAGFRSRRRARRPRRRSRWSRTRPRRRGDPRRPPTDSPRTPR